MRLVLGTLDTQSLNFQVTPERWGFGLVSNGGHWNLEWRDPDGTWHALPTTAGSGAGYDSTGLYTYEGSPVVMRFTGGTVGAKIWVWGVTL